MRGPEWITKFQTAKPEKYAPPEAGCGSSRYAAEKTQTFS
jgi:hypothetical protein